MHVLKIESISGVWREGERERKLWTYYSLLMIEVWNFFWDRNGKFLYKLKICEGLLRKGKSVREKSGGGPHL